MDEPKNRTGIRWARIAREDDVYYPAYIVDHDGDYTWLGERVPDHPPAPDPDEPIPATTGDAWAAGWWEQRDRAQWERDQRMLAELELQNSNPMHKRWQREREKVQRAVAAVESIITRGDHDHVELADMLYGQKEGQGLSRRRLLDAIKAHLRRIDRPDLIRGEQFAGP